MRLRPIRILMIVMILQLCAGAGTHAACLVPDAAYHTIAEHVLCADYHRAEAAADSLIAGYPEEPAGYLFKAAVIQYESTDYGNFARNREFMDAINTAARLARKKMRNDESDLWAIYYLGASQGMGGAWRVATDELVSGVLQGRKGGRHMEDIISRDPAFYDAMLLLGSYRFWADKALDPVKWLPIVGHDRGEDIAMVVTAIASARLGGPLSNTVFLEMLLVHDVHRAIAHGERVLAAYPDCRLFAWQLGEAYKSGKRFEAAVRVFSALAASYDGDPCDDGSGPLRCWWKLAVLAKSIGKKAECMYYCEKVIMLGSDPALQERQRSRIERAGEMIRSMKKDSRGT